MKTFAVIAGILAASVLASAAAYPSTVLNYQGRLANGTNLANGVTTNVFALWTLSSGGAQLYAETQNVTVVDGLYSTVIGTMDPDLLYRALTNFGAYLEVTVNGAVLSPRERLHAAPYAVDAVRRSGDTMTGALQINAGPASNLVITSSGNDVAIGRGAYASSTSVGIGPAAGTDHSVAIGEMACGVTYSVAIGRDASADTYGAGVGNSANGDQYGAAVGPSADGYWYGAAVGNAANASQNGVAIGAGADGNNGGAAIGRNAQAQGAGVAVGNTANGGNIGTAIGNGANGAQTNIAIGWGAKANTGSKRIAIGVNTTNEMDDSAVIRGTLYLDGATGIVMRSTFGTGAWIPYSPTTTNFVQKTGDTMSGMLTLRAGGAQDIAIGGVGNGIRIGQYASADTYSTVIGNNATGTSYGTALGRDAKANEFGVAVGRSAGGDSYGAALGYGANANNNGAAVAYNSVGDNFGAAVGVAANGSSHGAAVGYFAGATNYGAAVGDGAGGRDHGAAVGANAGGYNYGAAIGDSAAGNLYGAAVGNLAYGAGYGVAVGYNTYGYGHSVAIGNSAKAYNSNIAIGAFACAANDYNIIAIGEYVTNDRPNTARLRGTLYLDGGTSIMYRTTFGTGAWNNLLGTAEVDPVWSAASNGMQTQINGRLASNVWAAAGSTTNYVRRTGDTMTGTLNVQSNMTLAYMRSGYSMLTIGGGSSVEIGNGANGYMSGAAVGGGANGYSGAAVGNSANGAGGAAVGYAANGFQGVAIGNAAFAGGINRTAIGNNTSNSVDGTALIRGTLYLDGATGIVMRSTFGTGNWTNFPQYTVVTVVTGIVQQRSAGYVTNIVLQTLSLKALR